MTNLNYTFCR